MNKGKLSKKIVMFVRNDCSHDARVLKEAKTFETTRSCVRVKIAKVPYKITNGN